MHSAVLVFHFCKPLFGFRNGRVGSQDVYEGLQHVFPSSLTQDEKLRKIGNLLRKIAKEGFITKTISGKQWIITEKGEQELNYESTIESGFQN